MEAPSFSQECLLRNLAAINVLAPEVAHWLRDSTEGDYNASGRGLVDQASSPSPKITMPSHRPKPGCITVVVGAARMDQVWDLLSSMPSGHQVFILEPRAEVMADGLGRFDLGECLSHEALVILPPHQKALENALSRHPQLALAERVDILHMSGPGPDARADAVWARLFRILGHALKARELALKWEEPRGVNLIGNISHAALMGRAKQAAGCLKGLPTVIMEAGPSLDEALGRLGGRLGGAVVLCSDEALPRVLEAGVLPSAVVQTAPGLGRLSCYSHPDLHRVPLVAEETAHAPTIRAHPGPRFIALGARGTAMGPLRHLSRFFTPMQHSLGRQAEVAAFLGSGTLLLAGVDLVSNDARMPMPSVCAGRVRSGVAQAAAACSLGRVLARTGVRALNLSTSGMALPGAWRAGWDEVQGYLGVSGQPVVIEPLVNDAWLSAEEMMGYARALYTEAAAATRLWQRAAAPMADYPPSTTREAQNWLGAADALYVALAEQAAADPLQSAFLEGCLVRAFLRRYRLSCRRDVKGPSLSDACRGLGSCLGDLEARANELAQGLKETAVEFTNLGQARQDGNRESLREFARQIGRPGADDGAK